MRLALLLSVAAFAIHAADEPAAVKEVTAAITSLNTAMLHGDRAALERLFHADLSYEHSSAKTQTKAEAIAAIVQSAPKSLEYHDAVLHVYGATGVYKARLDYTPASGVASHLDILMVWIRTPGGWQLVARHSTKVE